MFKNVRLKYIVLLLIGVLILLVELARLMNPSFLLGTILAEFGFILLFCAFGGWLFGAALGMITLRKENRDD